MHSISCLKMVDMIG